MLNIGIIGRAGHAKRLMYILKKKNIKTISYHPKNFTKEIKKIKFTNKLNNLMECNGIIISCPTYLHWFYLNKLKFFKGHILVEKPAVSKKNHSQALISFIKKHKMKLMVNFNLRESVLIKKIEKIINNKKKFGKVISANIISSHGLAFKKQYYKNWRSKKKFSKGIVEVDTVHYVDIAIALFGKILDLKIFADRFAAHEKKFNPDTITLLLKTQKIPVYIFNSYSSAFYFKIIILGTNGIIEYSGNNLILKSPRNTFNKYGRFISPKIKLRYKIKFEDMWKKSLVKSVEKFILCIKKNKKNNYNLLRQNIDSMIPSFSLKLS